MSTVADRGARNVEFAKRATGAFLAYALSKASVLVAPLMVATVLPLSQYGQLEYSLSIGQIASVLLSGGIPGSIPYFQLKRRKTVYAPAFALHVLLVCTVCIAVSVVAVTTGHRLGGLPALTAGIASVQIIASAKFKSAGRLVESSLAESVLYLLLLVFAVCAYLGVVPRRLDSLVAILGTYLFAVLAFSLARFPWKTPRTRVWRVYRRAALYGMSLIPASLANVGLVSLGRVLIGVVGAFDQVAVYGVVYRLSAPIVAMYQFSTSLTFRKLYEGSVREFERYFVFLSAMLVGVSMFMVGFGPELAHHIIGRNAPDVSGRRDLFVLMAIVMILWSQLSLMELFLNRERRSIAQLPGLLAGCAVTLLPLVITRVWHADPTDAVAMFQGAGIAIAVLWQFSSSGVPRPSWWFARAIVLGLLVALLFSWCLIGIYYGVRT